MRSENFTQDRVVTLPTRALARLCGVQRSSASAEREREAAAMQSAERRRSSVETTNSAMFDEGGLADLLQPTDEPVRTSSFARSTDRKASRRGSREVSVTPSAEVASQRSTPLSLRA